MMTDKNWYGQSIQDTAKAVYVEIESGLSSAEAQKRLEEHGYNELEGKKRMPARDFFRGHPVEEGALLG